MCYVLISTTVHFCVNLIIRKPPNLPDSDSDSDTDTEGALLLPRTTTKDVGTQTEGYATHDVLQHLVEKAEVKAGILTGLKDHFITYIEGIRQLFVSQYPPDAKITIQSLSDIFYSLGSYVVGVFAKAEEKTDEKLAAMDAQFAATHPEPTPPPPLTLPESTPPPPLTLPYHLLLNIFLYS